MLLAAVSLRDLLRWYHWIPHSLWRLDIVAIWLSSRAVKRFRSCIQIWTKLQVFFSKTTIYDRCLHGKYYCWTVEPITMKKCDKKKSDKSFHYWRGVMARIENYLFWSRLKLQKNCLPWVRITKKTKATVEICSIFSASFCLDSVILIIDCIRRYIFCPVTKRTVVEDDIFFI